MNYTNIPRVYDASRLDLLIYSQEIYLIELLKESSRLKQIKDYKDGNDKEFTNDRINHLQGLICKTAENLRKVNSGGCAVFNVSLNDGTSYKVKKDCSDLKNLSTVEIILNTIS